MSEISTIKRIKDFDPAKTFDCGQSFRFEKTGENMFEGVALNRYIGVEKLDEDVFRFIGTDEEDFRRVWYDYFDLGTDYGAIAASFGKSGVMREACEAAAGIRILRQDPWETLCSFIISQNNNIPRIKKIISALSRGYGEEIHSPDGRVFYAFPTAQSLYEAGEEAIFALRTGFRAGYIYDAARRTVSGDIEPEKVFAADLERATEYLKRIKGVGDKVASCVLLFAYHKLDSFPIDVWVRRILDKYFGGEVPDFGEYAGVAQQYLFYYERGVVNGKTELAAKGA